MRLFSDFQKGLDEVYADESGYSNYHLLYLTYSLEIRTEEDSVYKPSIRKYIIKDIGLMQVLDARVFSKVLFEHSNYNIMMIDDDTECVYMTSLAPGIESTELYFLLRPHL